MSLNNQNGIKNQIEKLNKCLIDNNLTLPVFVRFRIRGQNLILPVSRMFAIGDVIKIYEDGTEAPASCLNLNDIIGVEAICDFNRKPFFLNDFNDVGEINDMEGSKNIIYSTQ